MLAIVAAAALGMATLLILLAGRMLATLLILLAKDEALAKAREAALSAVEDAQRPFDEAKAAFEEAAGQLVAQGEDLQASVDTVESAITAIADAISAQAGAVVQQLGESIADPTKLLPSQPSICACSTWTKCLFDLDQVAAELKQLSGIARGVDQAVDEAATALRETASMLIDVLKGLPAAIAKLTGQIADVAEAFAALKAGGAVTPKELSALLMTKSEALATPELNLPQVIGSRIAPIPYTCGCPTSP